MLDYEKYEKECEKIRLTNEAFLSLFEEDMENSGLSPKTIRSHLSNVDFFINDFLLYDDAHPMEDGVGMVDMFLGDFFIRKCIWSTPGNIKTTAASIKKFFKCMVDHKKIPKKDYEFLCAEIKTNMDQWQTDCARFNDPDASNPFYFF